MPNQTPIIDAIIRGPLVDDKGMATPAMRRLLQEHFVKLETTITLGGKFSPGTPIQGRDEGIGVTASKLDSTGKLLSTDAIAADGTGSPLTGGKRGFQALDPNNRLQNSFRGNAVNLSNVPSSTTTLSNDGLSTVISVASATDNFGAGTVSDSAGSVDPGAFGTFYVFHDDPTFSGGAVVYQSSTTPVSTAAADGRILDGVITTVGGSAKTGGGNNGGTTTGGAGGRGYTSR